MLNLKSQIKPFDKEAELQAKRKEHAKILDSLKSKKAVNDIPNKQIELNALNHILGGALFGGSTNAIENNGEIDGSFIASVLGGALFGAITKGKASKQAIDYAAKKLKLLLGDNEKIAAQTGIPQELEQFGRNFAQFKNKPDDAIDFLIKEKNGQVRGALYHSNIGEIDLAYGKVTDTKKHEGYGLAHIIDKHGEEVARKLPDIVMGGKVIKKDANRAIIENNNYHAVIKLDWHNNDKRWAVTAYEKI